MARNANDASRQSQERLRRQQQQRFHQDNQQRMARLADLMAESRLPSTPCPAKLRLQICGKP